MPQYYVVEQTQLIQLKICSTNDRNVDVLLASFAPDILKIHKAVPP